MRLKGHLTPNGQKVIADCTAGTYVYDNTAESDVGGFGCGNGDGQEQFQTLITPHNWQVASECCKGGHTYVFQEELWQQCTVQAHLLMQLLLRLLLPT